MRISRPFKSTYKQTVYYFISTLLLLLILVNCESATLSDEQTQQGTVYGQVFSIGHPGPVPEGWVPPKYLHFSTIIVINKRNEIVKEVFTNENGEFNFKITTGEYFLGLRESRIPTFTGPFEVKKNQAIYVDVYYDNGMR